MSEDAGNPSAPALPCRTLLYRLITKASWISPDSGRIQPAAFLRRPADAGLSVFIKDRCSIDQARRRLSGVRAVVTLHTGHILDLSPSLAVISDPEDETHAEIVGLPLPSDHPAEAIHLAELLAQQARVAWSAQ